MISNTQKSQIKQLLQSPQWDAVEQMMNETIQQMREEAILRETEWETLKAACLQQGRIEGINRIIQELYRLVQEIK